MGTWGRGGPDVAICNDGDAESGEETKSISSITLFVPTAVYRDVALVHRLVWGSRAEEDLAASWRNGLD